MQPTHGVFLFSRSVTHTVNSNRSKDELWSEWVTETVLAEINAANTLDPVPRIDDSGTELAMTEAYDSYRLERGSGDYL